MIHRINHKFEIERKFLLKKDYPNFENGSYIEQTYLYYTAHKEIRLRLENNKCTMTIKLGGPNLSREEFEYNIPISDGKKLLKAAALQPSIKKTRYTCHIENSVWEIDFFEAENKGLIIAEIELKNENHEIKKPSWIGLEVTNNPKYYNINLFKNPYKNWTTAS